VVAEAVPDLTQHRVMLRTIVGSSQEQRLLVDTQWQFRAPSLPGSEINGYFSGHSALLDYAVADTANVHFRDNETRNGDNNSHSTPRTVT